MTDPCKWYRVIYFELLVLWSIQVGKLNRRQNPGRVTYRGTKLHDESGTTIYDPQLRVRIHNFDGVLFSLYHWDATSRLQVLPRCCYHLTKHQLLATTQVRIFYFPLLEPKCTI
jgi:hypothetical protein